MSYPDYDTPRLTGAYAEIHTERQAQDAKWGEQNHPDVDPRDIDFVTRNEYAFRAGRWKQINAERATPTITSGRCREHINEPRAHTAWDGVLLEEVYEALAEADPAKLRAELVQVAAVATAWIEAIDRRKQPDADGHTCAPHGRTTEAACPACHDAEQVLARGDTHL